MIHSDFSYALTSKNAKKYSSRIPLLATKGCPVGCNFCRNMNNENQILASKSGLLSII